LPGDAANAAGFAACAVLLLEGSAYWLAKLRLMTTPGASLPRARGFAFASRANLPLLGAALLFVGWSSVTDPGADSLPGLGFALVAVIEHVNYFHTQLMYDNAADLRYLRRHGLHRAHLARDLARAERTPRAPAR
jgi:hypothetical protein